MSNKRTVASVVCSKPPSPANGVILTQTIPPLGGGKPFGTPRLKSGGRETLCLAIGGEDGPQAGGKLQGEGCRPAFAQRGLLF